jgi:hypothetical protein
MRDPSQFILPPAKKRASGVTLVELMIGIAVGGLVLSGVGVAFTLGSRSFAFMGNYVSMDQRSRNALDQMTRNTRAAKTLTSFATDTLVLGYDGLDALGTTSITYSYTQSSGELTEQRTTTNGTTTATLLTGCDRLQFGLRDRSFANTTDVTQGKVISVAWNCSRTVLGQKLTTEDMQQAQIVIRNK